MSKLEKARQQVADYHWAQAEPLASGILELIEEESLIGNVKVSAHVGHSHRAEGESVIIALNLEGFRASWHDEGKNRIDISWQVHHPR